MSLFQNREFSAAPQVLVLGQDGMAWSELDSIGTKHWKVVPWGSNASAHSVAALWAETREQRKWPAGRKILVCMQSSLIHQWLQPVPPQTQSLTELHTVAQARAKLLFGDPAPYSWMVAGQWDYKRPFFCFAVGSMWQELFAAIQTTHQHMDIASTLSLTFSQLGQQLPSSGWLAIAVEDGLHLVYRQHGHALSLRSIRLPHHSNTNELKALVDDEWEREKIRTQHTEGTLHWCNLTPAATPETLQMGAHYTAQQVDCLFTKRRQHAI